MARLLAAAGCPPSAPLTAEAAQMALGGSFLLPERLELQHCSVTPLNSRDYLTLLQCAGEGIPAHQGGQGLF